MPPSTWWCSCSKLASVMTWCNISVPVQRRVSRISELEKKKTLNPSTLNEGTGGGLSAPSSQTRNRTAVLPVPRPTAPHPALAGYHGWVARQVKGVVDVTEPLRATDRPPHDLPVEDFAADSKPRRRRAAIVGAIADNHTSFYWTDHVQYRVISTLDGSARLEARHVSHQKLGHVLSRSNINQSVFVRGWTHGRHNEADRH